MNRRLTLRRETLVALTGTELAAVDGAAPATPSCPAGPTDICPTRLPTCLLEQLSVPDHCL